MDSFWRLHEQAIPQTVSHDQRRPADTDITPLHLIGFHDVIPECIHPQVPIIRRRLSATVDRAPM
jgi:hypothetical protein